MTIILKNKVTLQFEDFMFQCAIGKKGLVKNKAFYFGGLTPTAQASGATRSESSPKGDCACTCYMCLAGNELHK